PLLPSFASTSAWLASSSSATSLWPLNAAQSKGVKPLLSLALTSACSTSSASTISVRPADAAKCKSVEPLPSLLKTRSKLGLNLKPPSDVTSQKEASQSDASAESACEAVGCGGVAGIGWAGGASETEGADGSVDSP